MAGSTLYPGALDNFAESSPTNLGDNDSTSRTHSERHDDIESAMEAVQGELGTDPAGAYSTVDARLNAIDNGGTSISVTASGTAVVPLTVAGTASQAADLAQFKNSGGTAVASISAAGAATFDSVDADSYTLSGSDLLTSTALLGTPTAPTAAVDTDTTQVATTAFVLAQAGTAAPVDPDTAAAVGTSTRYAREDHVHSADFGGSLLKTLPAPVPAGEQLLKQAVWWIDAAHSSASGQSVSNLGWGASALYAQLGSASGADSNDPKFLDWDGENYVYLPGVSGNYLSVPDEAALDITGDIDIRVRVALDDWTPSAQQFFAAKYNTTGNQRSWQFGVNTNGTLDFIWSADGSATTQATSSVAPTVVDGAALWVRVVLDVNDGGVYKVYFYTSSDGVSWVQLGSTVTGGTTTSVYASTAVVEVGSRVSGTLGFAAAKFYRAQVLDGTKVLDVDCSQIASGSDTSFTALTGQTVTINRSTSGRKTVSVVHPCWLFGTDDYMEVPARWVDASSGGLFLPGVAGNYASAPDSAPLDITGDLSLVAYIKPNDWTPAARQVIVAKWDSANNLSYRLTLETTGYLSFQWSADGTTAAATVQPAATGLTDGTAKWVRASLDVDNGSGLYEAKVFLSDDGSTWVQLGSTTTGGSTTSIYSGTRPFSVGGSSSGGSDPFAGSVYRAKVYDNKDATGSPVFDADFTGHATGTTSFTEDSTNAATVTVNTSGSGYVATLVPASGYVQPTGAANFQPSSYSLLDFGASESMTVVAAHRVWNTQGTNDTLVAKKANTTNTTQGWSVSGGSSTALAGQAQIGDGSAGITATSSNRVAGELTITVAVRDVSADTLTVYRNGVAGSPVTDTTTGSLSNAEVVRIARLSGAGTEYSDMELLSVALFRRALTSGEITTLSNYFAGRAA